jgi:hypothetical protein
VDVLELKCTSLTMYRECATMCLFRENGETGDVFGVVIPNEQRALFDLSVVSVGYGVTIVKPQLHGEWVDIPLVTTSEPLLPGEVNWSPFIPVPFPDSVSD